MLDLLLESVSLVRAQQSILGVPEAKRLRTFDVVLLTFDGEPLNTGDVGGLGVLWNARRRQDYDAYCGQVAGPVPPFEDCLAKPCADHAVNTAEKHGLQACQLEHESLKDLADMIRCHSLNCRFSSDQAAFRERTGLSVCRVFAYRFVKRSMHGAAIYLAYDTYAWWHNENAERANPEVIARWASLSSVRSLVVLHCLTVMLLKMYLPFMATADQPQTVGEYRGQLQKFMKILGGLQKSDAKLKQFFGHTSSGMQLGTLAVKPDSAMHQHAPTVANAQAVSIISGGGLLQPPSSLYALPAYWLRAWTVPCVTMTKPYWLSIPRLSCPPIIPPLQPHGRKCFRVGRQLAPCEWYYLGCWRRTGSRGETEVVPRWLPE